MRYLLLMIMIPTVVYCWDFTQERNTIPVYYNNIKCQSAWGTGYNYIHPTFCDINGDNAIDLFLGSDFNRLTLLINSGNQFQFNYEFLTDTFQTFNFPPPTSQRPCHPAFCDIDDDGDYDLILGAYNRLYYYDNIGDNCNYDFTLIEDYFQGIEYLPQQYPIFVDIDNDEDSDLFIGFGAPYATQGGRLAFYLNNGTPEIIDMDSVTSYFMNIDLGYECIPAFIDIDADSDYDMFLGDEAGHIHFYRNTGTPEVYNFVLESDNYFNIDVGFIASPAFCDIDGDGDYDLFVGNRSWGEDNTHGDIYFYENVGTAEIADFQLVTQNFITIDIGDYAYVDFADIDNDSLKEMFIGDIDGNINYFENSGSQTEPAFTFAENAFQNIWAQYQSRPTFGDLDADGDLDMIVSRGSFGSTSLHLYRNDGTPELPDFTLVNNNYLGLFWGMKFPRLIDIDADGDLDLFLGNDSNRVMYYENQGTAFNPQFVLADNNFLNTPTGFIDMCTICFGDLDGDGDYDLIRGNNSATILMLEYYENIGTPTSPNLILSESPFLGLGAQFVNCPAPYLEDIDNDGDLDLFVADGLGGVSFFRNNEITGVAGQFNPASGTKFKIEPCFPNPFNLSTTINFTLDKALPVQLKVYNQLGQEVWEIGNRNWELGANKVVWNAAGFSSGIYLISLESPNNLKQTKKVILLK